MANDWTQDTGIVSLKSYKTTMQHSAISQLEAYWNGLRAGRVVPSRSDVDPRGIDRALEYAFILERIAPGMARFRLAGMHLNDLMGMEVRGMPLTSFFVPDARRQVSDALEHVFEEPSIARFALLAERGIGKPQNEAQLLILPLKSDLGDVSRALGCLVCDGEIGRTPRRFAITEMAVEPLIAGIEPAQAPLPGSRRPAAPGPASSGPGPRKPATPPLIPGLAETGTPFEGKNDAPRPGRPTRVPWLRVVTPED
ncbi:PAS domain-containing protein [Mangrovicoccus algicola]|uniref:PAS domain-containing protein n=1 Tax=Mangrovicoccus algicola TaxID=2771008 RepID=A0A8J7CZX7_9RHOB|nr:PAS domain-containing protein [Mangrovicoccus algicola]MBE3638608.1 PAS domain-containing protein [Mangrovicoccus algicola]